MSKYYENSISLIGNTPLLKLNNIERDYNLKGNLFAKMECFNPNSSIKDRPALSMIEDAEQKGLIKKDTVIIEPTSGNTGVGLASICAVKGYKLILTMPESMSIERRRLLKAYGAEIVLTDGKLGMNGAIAKVEELKKEYKSVFVPNQFENPANPLAHYKTTAREIWDSLDGKIDVLVATIGSGGTVTGISKYLKEQNKDIEIIGVEPKGSNLLNGGKAGPHKIQGIGANFIPKVLKMDNIDRVEMVTDEEAYDFARAFAKKEGILVGISSGASLCVGTKLLQEEKYKGKNIVIICPDTGERYLSTGIYD